MVTPIDVDDDVDCEVDDVDGVVEDDVDGTKSGGNISRRRLVATSCCDVWW